jgi:hypothetical protein
MKYQIISYQLIFATGVRDTVRLMQPVMVADIEKYRSVVKSEHTDVVGVNLTYNELVDEQD